MRFFGQATALVVALVAVGGSRAEAALIIDQQQTTFTNATNLNGGASVGQSFTPTLGGIDFATFTMSAFSASTLQVSLYSGSGYYNQTALVATTTVDSIAASNFVLPYEFDFSSRVALGSGPYTLRLQVLTGSVSVFYSNNNPYAGGVMYVSDGSFYNTVGDLTFAEGISSAAAMVPEPASLLLTSLALAGGGAVAVRRRRA